jgi:NADPH-dependent glutamate synthase beta subunit-like oxidoreductase
VEGEAIAIRALKRYLADQEKGLPLPVMAPDSGKSVAIIGSGPAGMMAALDLKVRGHRITLFEAESAPGGMLRWAIPEFRLPLVILENEIDLLRRMGIEFRCGVALGRNKSLEDIKDEFHAVVIATGCQKHARLNIEGEDHSSVFHGLPFLREIRKGQVPEIGKKVVVIGGGNVAIDSAQTALRLGADAVTVVALESDEELPAFSWAVESALFEGVKLECSWGNPTFFFQNGTLKGIEFQRCLQVFDPCGDFKPRFDDGELKHLEMDTVIVAIGQRIDTSPFDQTGLVRNGFLPADDLTLQTLDEGVFLAGDVISGPSSVVEAMVKGRRAAESVDRYLKGESLRYGREYAGPFETEFPIDTSFAIPDKRAKIPQHKGRGRGDFQEIEQGLNVEAARQEAKRCYSCGEPFGKYRTCWFCLPCEVECPHDALWVEVPYLLR